MPDHQYQIIKNIPPQIFRAYDVRGIVGESLNENTAYTLGLSIGSEARALNQKTFAVARDGRLSGPAFVKALMTGILETGCDVIDIGAVPTPVLYFATHHLKTRNGVIVTGSHNPTNFNGFKIMINGITLTEEKVSALYQRIQHEDFVSGKGQLSQQDIKESYIHRITQEIKLKRHLKIVIDCGNGIAGAVAPQLFKSLNCDVVELFCDVDGEFPNHHPDPSIEENLQDLMAAVKAEKADIGLAFDGDGDRLGVVTNQGEMIYPDRQMMLFAESVLKNNPKAKIVFDVKCSKHLHNVIVNNNGHPIMSRTGHSILKKKMLEENAPLAGELSGHIFFNDNWYGFDDGLYAGARLLDIVSSDNVTSSELFHRFPSGLSTPEYKINIDENAKFDFIDQFVSHAHFINGTPNTIDGLRVEFPDGWGLLRVSNTTPTLIARFEADNEAALTRIKRDFRQQILNLNDNLEIPF